jgi:hypothetical protein
LSSRDNQSCTYVNCVGSQAFGCAPNTVDFTRCRAYFRGLPRRRWNENETIANTCLLQAVVVVSSFFALGAVVQSWAYDARMRVRVRDLWHSPLQRCAQDAPGAIQVLTHKLQNKYSYSVAWMVALAVAVLNTCMHACMHAFMQ